MTPPDVAAAYRGEQDLGVVLAPYEDLLTEVAELPPPFLFELKADETPTEP